MTTVETSHYCIGSVMGPDPFPTMVRDFQRIIGVEAREQVLAMTGRLPDAVIACVGGGSNAIGAFHAFIPDASVRLIGCEAGGEGPESGRNAATLVAGFAGVIHGMRTYLLQDGDGQTLPTHSVSAGLDYPGVGPEHSWLHDTGRASYRAISDSQAMDAFSLLCRTEGIIPAIESAHALAGALQLGGELDPGALLLVNLSGRGDKDVDIAARWFGHLDARGGRPVSAAHFAGEAGRAKACPRRAEGSGGLFPLARGGRRAGGGSRRAASPGGPGGRLPLARGGEARRRRVLAEPASPGGPGGRPPGLAESASPSGRPQQAAGPPWSATCPPGSRRWPARPRRRWRSRRGAPT